MTVTRDGRDEVVDEPLFAYLARELERLRTESPELPFDLNGGFVGYLGYELKADCGAAGGQRAELPDAFLLLADRLVAFDHELGVAHALALSREGDDGAAEALARRGRRDARADRAARRPDRRPTPTTSTPHWSSSCAAGASTTSRTSRPARRCWRPARATRSA